MAITSDDVLACAKLLAQQPQMREAHARTVVGRAYYAAYHNSKKWYAALGATGSLPEGYKGTGDHVELSTRLLNPASSLPEAQQKASRKRGVSLRALHADRCVADYELHVTVGSAEARVALSDAICISGTV